MFVYVVWFPESLSSCETFFFILFIRHQCFCFSFLWHFCASHPSCQGCGSLVSVSHSAGALSYRSTEDSSLPEILLGLIYNSATGQLSAEVIKGSHFKTAASNKPVSTYNSFCVELLFFYCQLGMRGWVIINILRFSLEMWFLCSFKAIVLAKLQNNEASNEI